MKFYNKLPTEDGLYWVLFKEFDSAIFRVHNPSPYFSPFSSTVKLAIRETVQGKTTYYCEKTYCPIDSSMFYFGEKISRPDSIEIMESWSGS